MEKKDARTSAFPMPGDAMGMNEAMKMWTKEAGALWNAPLGASNPLAAPIAAMTAANAMAIAVAGQAFRLWFDTTRAMWGDRPSIEDFEEATAESMEFLAYGAEPEGRLEGDDAPAPKRKVAKATKKAPVAERVADPAAAPVAAAPIAELMPEDFSPPRKMDKPAAPDDLKRIVGVGPKAEKLLNAMGVWTFAQIAGWTPAEIAWVDDFMALGGRIGRDGWVAQAAALDGAGGTK